MNPWKGVKGLSRDLWIIYVATLINRSGTMVLPFLALYLTTNLHEDAATAGMILTFYGVGSLITAPIMGKLSDKIGPHKVMLGALIVAGIIFIPQAFVRNPWQLMILRFMLGLATAGLAPSVNSLVKKITPSSLTGRVFGFNMAAQYLGVFGGSILGGQVAAYMGIRYVFFITSTLLLINALLVYSKLSTKVAESICF